MFSSKEHLDKKTGEFGVARREYLGQLVNEFHESNSLEAKRQVLANLANFAYDPINYEFLRLHRVLDVFLDTLSDGDEALSEYSVGGLCNLCLDPENQTYILHNEGIAKLSPLLKSENQEVVCNTITTLISLKTDTSIKDLSCESLVAEISVLSLHPNKRIANLSNLFLQEFA